MNVRILAFASVVVLAASCSPKAPEAPAPAGQAAPSAEAVTGKEIKPDMEKLKNPTLADEKAPETFKVKFNTTKGDIVLDVTREWSPLGADRFYNLVKAGYFTDIAFFRVIGGFMAQFGIHGDPAISAAWRPARIQDDPVKQSNARGYVSYAMGGPDTRTTQFFINFGNNSQLDSMGFSPFAKVTEGMDVVDGIYSGYGEGAPRGTGPDQGLVQMQGNAYLQKNFPKLDYIKSAELLN
jgi:peptidyl-prolyl cis-trans isomerase A (cyclophilin A)